MTQRMNFCSPTLPPSSCPFPLQNLKPPVKNSVTFPIQLFPQALHRGMEEEEAVTLTHFSRWGLPGIPPPPDTF